MIEIEDNLFLITNKDSSWTTEMDSQPSGSAADVVDVNESGSSKLGGSEPEGAVLCLQDRLKWLNQQVIRKVV